MLLRLTEKCWINLCVVITVMCIDNYWGRARAEPDGTCAETTFRLLAKRTSPFKSAEESVQSTAGSRGVRISVSNAGYTTFRGRVKVLATHFIRQFPLHFPSHASLCATTFRTQYTSLLSLHAKFITVIIVCVHVCNCFVQFNILLTVHHALILGNCPTWCEMNEWMNAQILFNVFIYL